MAQLSKGDLDGIIFGTGGWQAIIVGTLPANVVRILPGLWLTAREKRGDSSGYRLQPPLSLWQRRTLGSRGFCAHGFHVLFMRRSAPTPCHFLVRDMELDYGIEITTSHNPPHYSGIKLIVRKGQDAPVDTTRQLEGIVAKIRAEQVPAYPLMCALPRGGSSI